MPDVEPTSFLPPAYVRASAYTPGEVARLGIPRGLVPHALRDPVAPSGVGTTTTVATLVIPSEPIPPPRDPIAPELAAPTLGLGPRTRFRFQAHDAESPVVPPSNLTRDPATARRAGAVRKLPKMSGLVSGLSLLSVAIAAGAAGYFLGLPPLSELEFGDSRADGVSGGRAWGSADRRKLETILAAESLHQPREMHELIDQLRATRPHLAGLPVLEARAAVALRSFADADVGLVHAAQEPFADRAEIFAVRAANYANQRHLDEMRSSLSGAISIDPTRVEFFFQRAEADRRQGRTQESLQGYDRARALARPGRIPSRETIEFHRRLLLIESGREAELDAQAYQAAFAQPAPPADWLLTAAAVALQRKDVETGARWLRAARAAMPWNDYVGRMDDYFFRNHADEPGMKDLLPTQAERARLHAAAPPILKDP
jgi:hypothetical protein